MKFDGAVSCRLENRRITLRRVVDSTGLEGNCITTKRLMPDRTINKQHIHLSDEALFAIMRLRNYFQEIENKELNDGNNT
jgi:hypothetical protein